MKKIIIAMLLICAAALAFYGIKSCRENAIYNQPGFAHGNGRLEATEVAVASKLSGRIDDIYVSEGDYVKKGDKLALMQLNVLNAELAQAKAKYSQALAQQAQSKAQVQVKQSELSAAKATMKQKESSFSGAKKRFERATELKNKNALSIQMYENDETHYLTTQAEYSAAAADVMQAEAALNAATLSGYAASLTEYGMASSMGASLAAMVGLALPSYVWAELTYHLRIPSTWHDGMTYALALLKQAIPGLIGGAAIILASADNIGTPESPWHLGISLFIMLFAAIGNIVFRINAAALLILSALAGIMLL